MNPITAQDILPLLPNSLTNIAFLGSDGTDVGTWIISTLVGAALLGALTFWLGEKAIVKLNDARGMFVPRKTRKIPCGALSIVVVIAAVAISWNGFLGHLRNKQAQQAQTFAEIANGDLKIHEVNLDSFDQTFVKVTTRRPVLVIGQTLQQEGPTLRVPIATAQQIDEVFLQPRGLALH